MEGQTANFTSFFTIFIRKNAVSAYAGAGFSYLPVGAGKTYTQRSKT